MNARVARVAVKTDDVLLEPGELGRFIVIAFVTGATGALGRPTVSALLTAGWRVRALAHNDQARRALQDTGVEPVHGSLFDAGQLAAAIADADAVLHLATRIPPQRAARRPQAWADNDRLRAEGTRHLVDAALAAAVSTFVYPSVTFMYLDGGAQWLEYGAPTDAPEVLASTLAAEGEVARFTRAGPRGVVLRLAVLYGAHAGSTAPMLRTARSGVSPVLGPPDAYASFVWDEDAGAALVAALHAPAGTYDLADDAPAPRRAVATAFARAVGRRHLLRLPTPLARLAVGKGLTFTLRSQRISHRRFTEATGWRPTVRSLEEGLRRLAPTARPRLSRRRGRS